MNKLKRYRLYYDHEGQQKYVGTFYVRADDQPVLGDWRLNGQSVEIPHDSSFTTELAVHSGLSIKEDGYL